MTAHDMMTFLVLNGWRITDANGRQLNGTEVMAGLMEAERLAKVVV